MTKHISRFTSLAAVTVTAVILAGCCSLAKFCKVLIIQQPQSLTVNQGQNATFSVLAVKGGSSWTTNGLTYQWQVNTTVLDGNKNWVNLTNATNPSITIMSVQLANVGYYRCLVDDPVPSEPASLQMMGSGGSTITVYGTPVAKVKSASGCPGSYKGYVHYTNNGAGFQIVDRHVVASGANSDPVGNSAKIEYYGYQASDTGCSNNTANVITIRTNSMTPMPPGSVTVPPPAIPSSHYRFSLYFKQTPIPSGPYPLILNNFQ